MNTCRECRNAAIREKYALKRAQSGGGGSGNRPFSDPAFDGKEPREVIDLMSRAKRWSKHRATT